MEKEFKQATHVIFLGIADYLEEGVQPFPIGGIDLLRLSRNKLHIVYPGIINSNEWVFLVSYEFLNKVDLTKWFIRICDKMTMNWGVLKS